MRPFRRRTIKCDTKGCWGHAGAKYACGCHASLYCVACAENRSCFWCIPREAQNVNLQVLRYNHFHLHATPRSLAATMWLQTHEFQPVDVDNPTGVWCLCCGGFTCTKETLDEVGT